VLFRTTRLLGATRRHFAEYGLASTVSKVASWVQRRILRETPYPATATSDKEPRYRWPRPPRPATAGRTPRLATFGPLQSPLLSGATRFEDAANLSLALRDSRIDVVIFADAPWSDEIAGITQEAFSMSVPTAYIGAPNSLQLVTSVPPAEARSDSLLDSNDVIDARRQTMVACDVVLVTDPSIAEAARADRKPALAVPPLQGWDIGGAVLAWYLHLRRPRVSIVTLLYNKASELPFVLTSYERQSYDGEIEIVCVDDCSPDDSVEIVKRFFQRQAPSDPFQLKLVRNAHNSGNCESRNRGIAAATGDLLIIVDADCMLNRDFVQRHVDAHAFGDCEIVIGPLNIETMNEEPTAVLQHYERYPAQAVARAELQEPRNRASFLNCITRNFSIKRSSLSASELLFDPLFGYSADSKSGFGWEDIEMGYRMYLADARIKFVIEAFSIHVSAPAASESDKPARSLLNFRRLLQKHPSLADVSPAWVRLTYEQIVSWAARWKVDVEQQRHAVEPLLPKVSIAPSIVIRSGRPRLRVLTYRWHVPHQYELWKLPIDVTMMTGTGSAMSDEWHYGQRPLPNNATFRALDDINPRDYDLAILHFDENVLAPENTNGVIGTEWGFAFKLFCEQIHLPKVAICHGTPQFYGQYNFDYSGADLMQPIDAERQRLVDYLGDVHVVCNSYQAQAEWQFRRSSVIWHGFDPSEFPLATYQRGILSPLGPLVLSRPHYRGYFLYRQVFDGHHDQLRPETLRVPEPHPAYVENAYALAKFRRYVDELRRYSVYFNPTLRSPMPRARGEPMMCGLVTVSARNHDVERFIENGVDGFFADNADQLRSQLYFLVRDSGAARRIGMAARAKALKVFHLERYLAEWRLLLAELA
jgi:glycosyltransferase involved in cell wall biosynthesis